ncbi:MAG: glycosyltransferase [Bacteroidales bacterium]|nr:glycosyltransferase [Bacteroidales bacterium]
MQAVTDISVIIVNYNVRHFLEQCLNSVLKASHSLSTEIIVVDNASVDGSCHMVREKFPMVRLIENQQNVGFSRANNQGIRIASGKYILLLNPDTVIEEDTLEKCFRFMESHPDAGAMGVKMIDGKGNFLPESKRGFPTPMVSFWKITGLTSLFPRSRIFGRYYLGHLPSDQIHSIDILPGAFMFIRKEALEKTGLLDEEFFMYGEDIDLSWRIKQAGYENYYFPETTIIHYKGESTKKGSLNYVYTFYNAMMIFARKHFSSGSFRFFSLLIHMAIWIRAGFSALQRILFRISLPVADAAVIYLGYMLIRPFWEEFKFGQKNYYPPEYMQFVVPAYVFVWLVTVFYSGGYEPPVRLWRIIRGILAGSLFILVVYALLPASLRFSRALILLGTLWTLIALPLERIIMRLAGWKENALSFPKKKRIVVAGSYDEVQRVTSLLNETGLPFELAGYVSEKRTDNAKTDYLGTPEQLPEIIRVHAVDEIIFCARDIPSGKVIENMLRLSETRTEFKIAPEEGVSVIGSSSIDSPGAIYTLRYNLIARPSVRRIKRLMDSGIAFLLLLVFPFIAWIIPRPFRLLRNIFRVLAGKNTWVGYFSGIPDSAYQLPPLRPGILSPADLYESGKLSAELADTLNINYARDYRITRDLYIIAKAFRKLGR